VVSAKLAVAAVAMARAAAMSWWIRMGFSFVIQWRVSPGLVCVLMVRIMLFVLFGGLSVGGSV
jgi:hypothetical protein